MRSAASQRTIQKALKAAQKAGLTPTSLEITPDGKAVVCFGQNSVNAEDVLDREMAEWRQAHA